MYSLAKLDTDSCNVRSYIKPDPCWCRAYQTPATKQIAGTSTKRKSGFGDILKLPGMTNLVHQLHPPHFTLLLPFCNYITRIYQTLNNIKYSMLLYAMFGGLKPIAE
jgi:hypothetical protein